MRTLILIFLLLPLGLRAQEDEYRMEIGGALGTDFYLGDVNSTPFRKPGVMAGFLLRRNFNPRMGVKANLAFGTLRGGAGARFLPSDAATPGAQGGLPASVSFKRSVLDMGAQFELNLLGYGLGHEYQGVKRWSPYLTMGLGLTLAMGGNSKAVAGLNVPLGMGVKYKWKPRVNVGAEWTFRFTTTDALDVMGGQPTLSHPFGIQSSGVKNKDAYSFLMFFLTYDISPKCKECHNNK